MCASIVYSKWLYSKLVVFKIGCSFFRIFSYQDEVFDVNVTCLDKAIYTNENKIRLVAICHFQTCYNLLKQLAASLWITSFDNQLATSLLTTCNRLIVNKMSQSMRIYPDTRLFGQVCCKLRTSRVSFAHINTNMHAISLRLKYTAIKYRMYQKIKVHAQDFELHY